MKQTKASATQIRAVMFSWPYIAKRSSSTAWVKGFTAQMSRSKGELSAIFHSGYKALDMKNIGKMTKFITPAKFSSCLIVDEINNPRAPSITPVRISTGKAKT